MAKLIPDEQFQAAKLSNIEEQAKKLDGLLKRSLTPNNAALEARLRLKEVVMWAAASLSEEGDGW